MNFWFVNLSKIEYLIYETTNLIKSDICISDTICKNLDICLIWIIDSDM